jgi:hypothetical protein
VCLAQTTIPEIECPASIVVSEAVESKPDSWEVLSEKPGRSHLLRALAFYRGHPRKPLELKPSIIEQPPSRHGKGYVHIYDFREMSVTEVFAVCRFVDTSVILFKRLQSLPSRCVVSYPGADSAFTAQCQ